MRQKLKHSVYRLLNRSGLRPVLAASTTMLATLRLRKFCKVSYKDAWVHRFPSCTLVEPRITLWTPKQIENFVSDVFMYRYQPREGETIVDVGAGTGWETLFLSRSVGVSGRVIAIEAHPRVFGCLSRMRDENRLQNVSVVQAAVSDREGEVQLSDSPEHEGNSMIGAVSGLRVPCTTLDHICQLFNLSKVDFLKMNIEGAERLALSGMGDMVQKTKYICISCHDFLANEGGPNELRTKAAVIAFLREKGFIVSLRESDGRCNVRDFVYGLNEKLIGNHGDVLNHSLTEMAR
jgi:FkbM family methyltransferase